MAASHVPSVDAAAAGYIAIGCLATHTALQVPCANAMVKPSELYIPCSAAHNLSLMRVHAAGLVWCQMNIHSLPGTLKPDVPV